MSESVNRTLARGLDILTLLSETPRGLELHEVARMLALPKSSAHNLLHTLLDKRFIRYDADTAHYSLSYRLMEIGAAARAETSVETMIRQYMQDISSTCNETVHCGVPDGTDVVYVDKIESTRSIRMTSRIGLRMPLYCTAMGRAILAALPDEQVRELLAHQQFEQLTPHTVCSMDELLDILAIVREKGFATETEENNENVCCIGVAIRDRDGIPRYAISVSMPTFRADAHQKQQAEQRLLRAQRKIEQYFCMA